jgi:hypothetical protein
MYYLLDTMMAADVHANNLTDFRAFIESEESGFLTMYPPSPISTASSLPSTARTPPKD